MLNDECQMSNDKCQLTNVKCQMSNVKYQISNIKWPMTNDNWLRQMSNVKYQMSAGWDKIPTFAISFLEAPLENDPPRTCLLATIALVTIVLVVVHHWSNDGMVTYHRWSLGDGNDEEGDEDDEDGWWWGWGILIEDASPPTLMPGAGR